MKQHGNILLTGAEKTDLGILVFDVTSVPASFAAEESELLSKFLKVTADMNEMWNSGKHTDEMLPVIAKDSGMDLQATRDTINTFVFPSVEEQLSAKWLGGGAQTFMKGVAQVFLDAGSIDSVRSTYEDAVNPIPLSDASRM